MNVAEGVGRFLVRLGVSHAFGVVGSGNFHVTNAMIAEGATFVAARHEGGAATMADSYARMSAELSVVTVHQGCGLTNAMTGITEAAKSRTSMIVIAAEATEPTSNFAIDQEALALAVGARSLTITDAAQTYDIVGRAVELAQGGRQTVLLNLPLSVQAESAGDLPLSVPPSRPVLPVAPHDLQKLAEAINVATRPVFVAGRGARSFGPPLQDLAARCGALVATSAVAKGLFRDDPYGLDISGGFSSPLAAELISQSDLIIGWGCALNMWTMRHGALIAPDATVIQVDDTADVTGRYRSLTFGVVADVGAAVHALRDRVTAGARYRNESVRERIATRIRWRDEPYDDLSGDGRIDPRSLSIAIDDMLPTERIVAIDSGNFMGYPSMFLSVPDENGFCFTQAFQSVGLGLATAIGAALAQPHRLPVAALGDGGVLMASSELETVVRLGLPMLVVVYNDAAYGAEVHHFGPDGYPLSTVTFPDTDIAQIAAGYGFAAVTARNLDDLLPVTEWLERYQRGDSVPPMLIDAKVLTHQSSWWLEEAFRGH